MGGEDRRDQPKSDRSWLRREPGNNNALKMRVCATAHRKCWQQNYGLGGTVMLGLGPDTERGKEMAERTERCRYHYDGGQPLDVSKRKAVSRRLLSHELTGIIQRNGLQRLPQFRLASRNTARSLSASTRNHSLVGTVLLAPAENTAPTHISWEDKLWRRQ